MVGCNFFPGVKVQAGFNSRQQAADCKSIVRSLNLYKPSTLTCNDRKVLSVPGKEIAGDIAGILVATPTQCGASS